MSEDYIRTARAKGLSERRVIVHHGVRAAITPIVTVLGLDIGILLGGAILTETVFNIPGIGRLAYEGDHQRRPAGDPGHRAVRGAVHRGRQPGRRHRLRVRRSAGAVLVSAAEAPTLLEVSDLRVQFPTEDGVVHAVDGISYEVRDGKTLGIVGESGSGKTVSSLTTLGLTRGPGRERQRQHPRSRAATWSALGTNEMRSIRGNDIAMIFQDPLSSLHPFYKVGTQLIEAIQAHSDASQGRRARAGGRAADLVGIPDPAAARRPVSARVLRRHAPARDDRDGAGQRAEAADRRRADDRARRDRPGADPGAARRASRSGSGWRSS